MARKPPLFRGKWDAILCCSFVVVMIAWLTVGFAIVAASMRRGVVSPRSF